MGNKRSGKKKATRRAAGKKTAKKTARKAASKKKPAKKSSRKAASKKKAAKKTGRKAASKKKPAKKSSRKAASKKKAAKKTARKAASKKKPAKKSSRKKAAPSKKASKKKASKKASSRKPAPTKKSAKKAGRKKAGAKVDRIKRAAKKPGKPKLRPVGGRKKTVDASVPPAAPSSKRNFGLRGAAPWVARHAAKHAEELRRRNAEPPPPGSARATLRVPPEAERIKSEVAELHQLTSKVRTLRKKLEKGFFEIGELLAEVQEKELHVAKGSSTFESFLDREVDLPRTTSQRLIRIAHTFQRETAYDFGLDRLTSALAALDGEVLSSPPSHPSSRGWSSTSLPPKPPIRFDD